MPKHEMKGQILGIWQ